MTFEESFKNTPLPTENIELFLTIAIFKNGVGNVSSACVMLLSSGGSPAKSLRCTGRVVTPGSDSCGRKGDSGGVGGTGPPSTKGSEYVQAIASCVQNLERTGLQIPAPPFPVLASIS